MLSIVIGYLIGRNMTIDVSVNHIEEMIATGIPNTPKLNSPSGNVFRATVQRNKIGIK